MTAEVIVQPRDSITDAEADAFNAGQSAIDGYPADVVAEPCADPSCTALHFVHGDDPVEALAAAAEVTGGPALSQKMLELRDAVEVLAGQDDVVTIEIQEEPNENGHQVVLLSVWRMPSDPSKGMQAVVPMTRELVDDVEVAVFAPVIWGAVGEGFSAYYEARIAPIEAAQAVAAEALKPKRRSRRKKKERSATNIDTLTADLESHHIEGIAREGNVPFSVSLVSHVVGNLWQGGCTGGVRLPDDFKYVVSLYPWEQYELGPATERVEFRLFDSATIPGPEQLYEIARTINTFRARGKTLVHCQAGLNRSALTAGLALVLDGMAPAEAIALLRDKRSPAVLSNKAFENWLLSQPLPSE